MRVMTMVLGVKYCGAIEHNTINEAVRIEIMSDIRVRGGIEYAVFVWQANMSSKYVKPHLSWPHISP